MTRIAILPYGPSNSVNDLRTAFIERGLDARKLRVEGSVFRGREGDLLINWGNSNTPAGIFDQLKGDGVYMNHPLALRKASMKTEAFEALSDAHVSTVEWTTSREIAQEWVDAEELVYARTVLQGHSGEGIVAVHKNPETIPDAGNAFEVVNELPNARLYTKGITAQRREFRIHVMNGVVTYVQQKKRGTNYRDNPAYSNVVRNYHTGWIYATSNVQPNDFALTSAKEAVQVLGLDFGAVDVITRGDDAWVLEVNTAPGLQGTNLETYVENFSRILSGEELIEWVPTAQRIAMEHREILDAEREMPQPVEPVPVPVPQPVPFENAWWQGELVRPAEILVANNPFDIEVRPPVVEQVVVNNELVDQAFYFAMVSGVKTVVQYEEALSSFFMIAFDFPLNHNEVEIISRIPE